MEVQRHGFLYKLGSFIQQHVVYGLVLEQNLAAVGFETPSIGQGILFVTVAFN